MGGSVGCETVEASDAPAFTVGARAVLFVENHGTRFVPLAGIVHGRFRGKRDAAGRDAAFTNEGSPLSDVTQLGKNEVAASAGHAMSAQTLKQAIHAKALAQSAQH